MRKRPLAILAAVTLAGGSSLLAASPAMAADFGFDDVPDPAPVSVDDTTVPRTISVSGVGAITDVNITLDFHKVDGSCAAPGTGSSYSDEIGFTLTSPEGTTVVLIRDWATGEETYTDWEANVPRVTVALDDQAAAPVGPTTIPVSGAFQPVEPLSAFNGQDPNGDWTLNVINADLGDPLCYFGAHLQVSDASVVPGPTPPAPTPPVAVQTMAPGAEGTTATAAMAATALAATGLIALALVLTMRRRSS